jgi:hypothetical protein
MVKNMCFFLRGYILVGSNIEGVGYVYLGRFYQSNRWVEGGPLSHKQGGLIHQFGVLAWHDLKNKLLLLLL